MSEIYLIALGSNMRVPGIGSPRCVLAAALSVMAANGVVVRAVAPVMNSAAMGPSARRYANGAALVETPLLPSQFLTVLQNLEHQFGRGRAQRRGQRWRARALDLDIILWSGGVWASPRLTLPHREMRGRDFVLRPAAAIAREWRDPVTGLSVGALYARLIKPKLIKPRGT